MSSVACESRPCFGCRGFTPGPMAPMPSQWLQRVPPLKRTLQGTLVNRNRVLFQTWIGHWSAFRLRVSGLGNKGSFPAGVSLRKSKAALAGSGSPGILQAARFLRAHTGCEGPPPYGCRAPQGLPRSATLIEKELDLKL